MKRITLVHDSFGYGASEEHPATFDEVWLRLLDLRSVHNKRLGMPYSADLVLVEDKADIGSARRLCVGMGDNHWVLTYNPGDSGDACKISLGNRSAKGACLFYFGDHTLMSNKYLISEHQAMQAVRTWCEEGALSDRVEWTEELFPPR
ncbi:MAG: Imm1 family immunity protein [Planctomycetota bacterium]|nr:Imm1 family immunity protein [Planctomycetota bacterium]